MFVCISPFLVVALALAVAKSFVKKDNSAINTTEIRRKLNIKIIPLDHIFL